MSLVRCTKCEKLTYYPTQTAPMVVYCLHCGKEIGVR